MVRAAPKTGEVQAESKTPAVLLSIVPTDMDMEVSADHDDALAQAIGAVLAEPPVDGLAVQETVVTTPEALSKGRIHSTLVPNAEMAQAALAPTEPMVLPDVSDALVLESALSKDTASRSAAPMDLDLEDAPAPKGSRVGWILAMGGGLLLGGGAVSALAVVVVLLGVFAAGAATLVLLRTSPAPMPTEVAVVVPAADLTAPAAEVPAVEIVTPADASVGGSPTASTPAASAPAAPAPARPAGPVTSAPSASAPSAPAPSSPAPSNPAPSTPVAPAPVPAATTPVETPAPAPAPAPAPSSSAAGIAVKILSDPPAAILTIDGQAKGRTPAKLTLEPGTHAITLTAGSAKGSFTIDVAPDESKFCYGLSGKKVVRTGCE